MSRHPPEHLFAHRVYVCGVNGCTKTCSTQGGMKQHIQKWHLHQIRPQPPDPFEVLEAYEDDRFTDGVDLGLDEANTDAGQRSQEQKVSYHPILDGTLVSAYSHNTSADHYCTRTPCDHTG